jgi:hypothetical protein
MVTAILNLLAALFSALPKLLEQIAAASRARRAEADRTAKDVRNAAALADALRPPAAPPQPPPPRV